MTENSPPFTRKPIPFALSILFAIAPCVAGIVRANSSSHDLRLLWMALVASAGAILTVMVVKTPRGKSPMPLALSIGALSFGLTTFTAYFLGAKALPGVLAIGAVFGFCFAMYCWLHALATRRE